MRNHNWTFLIAFQNTYILQNNIRPIVSVFARFDSHLAFAFTTSQPAKDNNNNEGPIKIKSSLYSPYYAEACNELRCSSPRLSARATQLRRIVATVASRWRHCVDLTVLGIEPQTSRTDSVRLATELTASLSIMKVTNKKKKDSTYKLCLENVE